MKPATSSAAGPCSTKATAIALSQTTGPRTSPANSVQRYYDGAGNLSEEVTALSQANPAGSGVTSSPNAAISDYVYDFTNNLVWEMDPVGNETTMTYDANGQMLSKRTAGLRTGYSNMNPAGRSRSTPIRSAA